MRLPILALACVIAACSAPPTPAADPDLIAAAASASGTDALRRQQERVTGTPFVGGNQVELLRDGPRALAAMADAIRGARRRVDVENYDIDAEEGARFAELLLAKRAEGVEVNLIFDAWGSLTTPSALFDMLRRGGVRVLEFNPAGPDLNWRDHRKMLVVDGAVVVVGGVNLNSVHRNRPGDAPGSTDTDEMAWRDATVRIRGPVASQFQQLFERTWREQGGPPLPPAPAPPAPMSGGVLVQAVNGDPTSRQPLIYRTLLSAIGLAQRSVHLTTGFFAPTPDLARALTQAARRGVDVQIVLPAHSDSTAAIAAGRSHYADLLAAGVRIHERQGRVMHAKAAVIDGAWSAVGSSNLDWRSVVHNQEVDAIILDERFGQAMEAMFADDVAGSRTIDPAAWARRPLPDRIGQWGARLIDYFL